MSKWMTEQRDLELATEVIERYKDYDDEEFLNMYLIGSEQGDATVVCNASWLEELNDIFVDEYGLELGDEITTLVVTRLLLEHEVIH